MSRLDDQLLPTQHDFDPFDGDLDAQCAWTNFGGLTLDEAYEKFRQAPEIYQEDFMFMGGKAFAFYFSIIENYMRCVAGCDGDDDRQAWIIAQGIRLQFDGDRIADVRHLAPRVIELANFVRDNIRRFANDEDDRQRVADAWTELVAQVEAAARR